MFYEAVNWDLLDRSGIDLAGLMADQGPLGAIAAGATAFAATELTEEQVVQLADLADRLAKIVSDREGAEKRIAASQFAEQFAALPWATDLDRALEEKRLLDQALAEKVAASHEALNKAYDHIAEQHRLLQEIKIIAACDAANEIHPIGGRVVHKRSSGGTSAFEGMYTVKVYGIPATCNAATGEIEIRGTKASFANCNSRTAFRRIVANVAKQVSEGVALNAAISKVQAMSAGENPWLISNAGGVAGVEQVE